MHGQGSQSGITVCVLTFNTDQILLEKCLGSIDVAAGRASCPIEVLLIDNGSKAVPAPRPMRYCKLNVLANGENQGFGRAMNAAIRVASSELVLLLNPDAELDTQAFTVLADASRQFPETAVFGGLLINNGEIQVDAYWIWFSSTQHFVGRYIRRRRWRVPIGTRTLEVEKVCGAALAGRRDELIQLGPFNEDFFLYGEDADLSLRAKRAGFKLILLNELKVTHQAASSAQTHSGLVEQARTDAMIRLQRLYLPKFMHAAAWLELGVISAIGLVVGGRSSYSRSSRVGRFKELRRWGLRGMVPRFVPSIQKASGE